MPADVEVKTFVGRCARNAAYINRIGFQDCNLDLILGEKIGGGQTSRTRTNNSYRCFHFVLSDPIAPRKIPDVPTLNAEPRRTDQRGHGHAERPQEHRRHAKLVQEVQKRQHD